MQNYNILGEGVDIEALALDSFNKIKQFISEEKRKYTSNVIRLSEMKTIKYLESFDRFEIALNSYLEICNNTEKYSLVDKIRGINKLNLAIKDCFKHFKNQHSVRNSSSYQNCLYYQLVKEFDTANKIANETFDFLTLKMINNINCEGKKILDCDLESFSSFEK